MNLPRNYHTREITGESCYWALCNSVSTISEDKIIITNDVALTDAIHLLFPRRRVEFTPSIDTAFVTKFDNPLIIWKSSTLNCPVEGQVTAIIWLFNQGGFDK